MKKIVSSLFVSLFLTISCSNENTNISGTDENVSTFNDIVSKIYNSPAKNHILIENLGGIYTKEKIYSITSRSIGSEPLNLSLEGRNIYGNVAYSKEGNSWFSDMNNSSLFGKKIYFTQNDGKLTLSSGGNINGKVEEAGGIYIYMPDMVQLGISGLDNGRIVPGTVITWNKDVNNENGILLGIEYNPYEQEELTIRQAKPQNDIKYDIVDDDGSYTVTEDDLKNFPKGSYLSFYIGRMAYTMDSGGSVVNDTSIAGLTAVRADFQINY